MEKREIKGPYTDYDLEDMNRQSAEIAKSSAREYETRRHDPPRVAVLLEELEWHQREQGRDQRASAASAGTERIHYESRKKARREAIEGLKDQINLIRYGRVA